MPEAAKTDPKGHLIPPPAPLGEAMPEFRRIFAGIAESCRSMPAEPAYPSEASSLNEMLAKAMLRCAARCHATIGGMAIYDDRPARREADAFLQKMIDAGWFCGFEIENDAGCSVSYRQDKENAVLVLKLEKLR